MRKVGQVLVNEVYPALRGSSRFPLPSMWSASQNLLLWSVFRHSLEVIKPCNRLWHSCSSTGNSPVSSRMSTFLLPSHSVLQQSLVGTSFGMHEVSSAPVVSQPMSLLRRGAQTSPSLGRHAAWFSC